MKKSNIPCRKLQLVVSKHCICTDTNTKWKTVDYMYTTLHCRVCTSNILYTKIVVMKFSKSSGPFSQSRSHIITMSCNHPTLPKQLEEKQRADARERKESGMEWKQHLFHLEGETWVYNDTLDKRLAKLGESPSGGDL